MSTFLEATTLHHEIEIAFQSASEVSIIATKEDGLITIFNRGAEKMLGYTVEEVIGKHTPLLFHLQSEVEKRGKELSQLFHKNIEGFDVFVEWARHWKSEEREWTFVRKDGNHLKVNLIVTPMIHENQLIGFIGIAVDITQRKEMEERLKNENQLLQTLSTIDCLTEIYNRRAFDEFLRREWTYAARNFTALSLILIDIDYFKKYNDVYGHLKGDECLKRIASILQNTIKRGSDFLARYGGEEFVIILPNTSLEQASLIAQNIHKEIEAAQIEHLGSEIDQFLTCSIGVTTLNPRVHKSCIDLIEEADKALYQAKRQGRNQAILV